MSRKTASTRGETRKRSGPMPMASMASTSSATVIVPSSRGVGRADPRGDHDAGDQRPELAREADRHQPGHEPLRAEGAELVAGEQRHREPEEKRDERDQRHRADAGAVGLLEENR